MLNLQERGVELHPSPSTSTWRRRSASAAAMVLARDLRGSGLVTAQASRTRPARPLPRRESAQARYIAIIGDDEAAVGRAGEAAH